MDKGLSIYDRLEQYALKGHVSCELNLYSRQIDNLVRDGLAVQRGLPVPDWKGQYRCKIGWRYAFPDTIAWQLLEIAAKNNSELKAALKNPDEGDVPFPYDTGWS